MTSLDPTRPSPCRPSAPSAVGEDVPDPAVRDRLGQPLEADLALAAGEAADGGDVGALSDQLAGGAGLARARRSCRRRWLRRRRPPRRASRCCRRTGPPPFPPPPGGPPPELAGGRPGRRRGTCRSWRGRASGAAQLAGAISSTAIDGGDGDDARAAPEDVAAEQHGGPDGGRGDQPGQPLEARRCRAGRRSRWRRRGERRSPTACDPGPRPDQSRRRRRPARRSAARAGTRSRGGRCPRRG